jgi:hypothetical protein
LLGARVASKLDETKGEAMEIELNGGKSDDDAAALLAWLRDEKLPGARFERSRASIAPGAMGGELLPIITAVVSSPLLLELAKCLVTWITVRRPKGRIVIREGGRETIIETSGDLSPETISAQLRGLQQPAG